MYTAARHVGRCLDPASAKKLERRRRRTSGGLKHRRKDRTFATHTVLTEGVAFHQIVRAAKRLRCDLIVLATHGRTGLVHAIMGSVAENVLRRAPCPVLSGQAVG